MINTRDLVDHLGLLVTLDQMAEGLDISSMSLVDVVLLLKS